MNKNKLLSPYNVILLYILNACFDDCFILIILECSEICRCYRGFLCCGYFSGLGLLNMWKRQRNASLDPNLISRACGERRAGCGQGLPGQSCCLPVPYHTLWTVWTLEARRVGEELLKRRLFVYNCCGC